MTEDETEDADGIMQAARLCLAALGGAPVPALVPPAVLRGLVQITYRAMQLAVLMAGADPDNREIQDRAIRTYLETVIAGNMFLLDGFGDPLAGNES